MRKGLTACTGGACSVLRAWAVSAAVVSIHDYLLKAWERGRTLLMYSGVKARMCVRSCKSEF